MKRVIMLIVALAVLALFFQLIVNLFINKHDISYTIDHKDKTYSVREEFIKEKADHYYTFLISDKNKTNYLYSYNKNFNKQKKVIKDILEYKKDNLKCIYPVLKDTKSNMIICNLNGEMVSYDYLKQNNINTDEFINIVKSEGYTVTNNNDLLEENKDILINSKFIEGYELALWRYKTLYVINNEGLKDYELLSNDNYENDLGMLVKDFYVVANTDSAFDFDTIYTVDLRTKRKESIYIDTVISKDSYFLGGVDNSLYIMDRANKKEYSLNIKTKELKEVGNKEEQALFYNNKWSKENIYTISDNKTKFNLDPDVKILNDKYNAKVIKESINKYYFVTNDNKVYYVLKNDFNHKLLLFNDNNIKDLKIAGDSIFFITGDSINMYDTNTGYRKVVKSSELLYNTYNIYDVLKK